MLSEQLSLQDRKDAEALMRVRSDEGAWKAIERIVEQLDRDIFLKWSADQSVDRQWVSGAREIVRAFIPSILQRIEDAQLVVVEEKHAAEIGKAQSEDGVGSGDLAI
jgi:hypothetical protein